LAAVETSSNIDRTDQVISSSSSDALLGNRTQRKIARRLLPFLCLLYLVAYLDRANVAFAKLSISADLRFSEAVYGFGAGIFFIGYLLLEIPGALIVERWSARRWFARILVSWGLCTVLVGFVKTANQFYLARFLLGVAEAGFYPGIIVYLTHWFPRKARSRSLAGFIVAIPVSLVVGAPISALILQHDWLGIAGWRWVFILEGLPAIVLGIIALFYLTDRPKDAAWLEPEERAWITQELETEKAEKRGTGQITIWKALRNRNVLICALSIFFANIGSYVFVFWLPSTIHRVSTFSAVLSTLYSAVPFAVAIGFVLLSGRSSDRSGRVKLHASTWMALAGLFLMLSAIPGQPFPLVMTWLCLTAGAVYAWPPPFWALPTLILSESAAAVSIGFINMSGVLGAFVGPALVGYLLSAGYSNGSTTVFLSTCFIAGAALILGIQAVKQTLPSSKHRSVQS
jgi:MFS transporter, ACS family, tartrate transporter